MRRTGTRFGVTMLAALTLAGGGVSAAHAADGSGDGHQGGHNIVVKGDKNQVVQGNGNVVGRDVSGSEPGGGETGDESAVSSPYATVRPNVSELTERTQPRTTAPEVARFGPNTKVPISCFLTGESVHGNTTWYRVREESPFRTGYISAYYTTLTGAVDRC